MRIAGELAAPSKAGDLRDLQSARGSVTTRPGERPAEERRRVERVPERASDDLVGAVVRLMPDAAVAVDSDGLIVAANALAEAIFGYPAGGLTGEQVDHLVPERFRPDHSGHRSSYMSRATQRPMGAGLELWAKRRDGSEFPVDVSLAPLGVPERPLTLAAVRDLTQRRAEWAALGRLAAIVSASEDAIVSMDLKGTVTSWNPGAQRLFGYRAEEIVGRPIFRLVAARRRGEVEEQLARMRAGMRMATRDARRIRKNGDEIDVSESMSLIREPSGEPIGYTWLMRDVAERKLAEIELRRLLVETQGRERWLESISEIRLAFLAGGDVEEWLDLIARRVCELADTESSAILLVTEGSGPLVGAACEGEPMSRLRGEKVAVDGSIFGTVLTSGETWASSDLPRAGRRKSSALHLVPQRLLGSVLSTESGTGTSPDSGAGTSPDSGAGTSPDDGDVTGPVVVAPLKTADGIDGVLVVSRAPGRGEFDDEDVRMVESFAQQAGLAVEIAKARDDLEQLALVADRERIARDLHDHVIQRLFAVGIALQAAAHSITDARALGRINDSVEELDATIRDVRSTIFSLEIRATDRAETSARSRILSIASKAADGLGFQPRIQFEGPVDTRVPEEMVPDVLAVVRESLSNAARHASASTVELRVRVNDDLVITVTDDGIGPDGAVRWSGLANLRARAEGRRGSMSIGSAGARGTRIEWRVPLPG